MEEVSPANQTVFDAQLKQDPSYVFQILKCFRNRVPFGVASLDDRTDCEIPALFQLLDLNWNNVTLQQTPRHPLL